MAEGHVPDDQRPRGGWGDQEMGGTTLEGARTGMKAISDSVRSLQGHSDVSETPSEAEFGRLDRALNELDAMIGVLANKIKPALGPDYPREDSSEKEPTRERQSELVEAIRENVLRVRSLRDVVEMLNSRLEL